MADVIARAQPLHAAGQRYTVWKREKDGRFVVEHEETNYFAMVAYMTQEKVEALGEYRLTCEVTLVDAVRVDEGES